MLNMGKKKLIHSSSNNESFEYFILKSWVSDFFAFVHICIFNFLSQFIIFQASKYDPLHSGPVLILHADS